MKEEDKIMKKCGTKNPFTVPEGYFDNLTNDIMSRLPEKEDSPEMPTEISLWERVRPWLYMAAMFVAILLPIRFIMNSTLSEKEDALTANNIEQEVYMDEYIDAIIDHSMMDDYTLYRFLTDADTEYFN